MGLHARMSEFHRALCFILRNPPEGVKKTKLKDIKKLVRDEKGGGVTLSAISFAAKTFKKRTAEYRKILQVVKMLRYSPPGHGVDAREVHDLLRRGFALEVTRV